jgi:topoisomerase-4 subunit A
LLTLPEGAQVLLPARVLDLGADRIAVVTLEGRLLVFPAADLPVLNKGKGNKLIQIASEALGTGADRVIQVLSLPTGRGLKVLAGKRHLTLSPSDLSHYEGARARRGNPLPRGFQRVDRIEVSEA